MISLPGFRNLTNTSLGYRLAIFGLALIIMASLFPTLKREVWDIHARTHIRSLMALDVEYRSKPHDGLKPHLYHHVRNALVETSFPKYMHPDDLEFIQLDVSYTPNHAAVPLQYWPLCDIVARGFELQPVAMLDGRGTTIRVAKWAITPLHQGTSIVMFKCTIGRGEAISSGSTADFAVVTVSEPLLSADNVKNVTGMVGIAAALLSLYVRTRGNSRKSSVTEIDDDVAGGLTE
jgi:hypothetical protein